jgi:hypothetical protein
MDSMKADMNAIVFTKEEFSSPIPYSMIYMPWEANQVS